MLGVRASPKEARDHRTEGEISEAQDIFLPEGVAIAAASHRAAEEESGADATVKADAPQPLGESSSRDYLVDPAPAVAALLEHCLAKQHPSEALENAKGTDNMTCLVVVFGTPEVA